MHGQQKIDEPRRKQIYLTKKIIGMCTSVLQKCRYLFEDM